MRAVIKVVISVVFLGAFGIVLIPVTGIGQEGHVGTKGCSTCHPQVKKAYDLHGHAGVTGDMVEEGQKQGIGCESCHGLGKEHVDIGPKELQKLKKSKGDLKILGTNDNKKGELCMSCHRLTDNDNIELASDNLIKGLQQYSELSRSKKTKFKMTCGSCHDPHTTAKDQAGIKRKCLDCHKGKFKIEVKIPAMEHLSCENCHMPYAVTNGKGTMVKDYQKGEIRSHIFGITADSGYKLNDGSSHASLTEEGLARLTVEMTCFACHKTGEAPDMPREKLLDNAVKIH